MHWIETGEGMRFDPLSVDPYVREVFPYFCRIETADPSIALSRGSSKKGVRE